MIGLQITPSTNEDWVRLYISRAHKMISAALTGESLLWLALPSTERERQRYEGLKRAAEALDKMVLKGIDRALAIDAMLQFGILMGIAKEWPARRMVPISAQLMATRAQSRKNLANQSAGLKLDANSKMIAAFKDWAATQDLPTEARERAKLFANAQRYPKRGTKRRRIFKLAKEGKLA